MALVKGQGNYNYSVSNLQLYSSGLNVNNCRDYFAIAGKKVVFGKNNRHVANKHNKKTVYDGWNTCYGYINIKPNYRVRHFWAIQITDFNSNSIVAIGLDESAAAHKNTYFHGNSKTVHYAYSSEGIKYSQEYPKGDNFSDKYRGDDVIFVLLDGYQLSVGKVYQEFIEASPNIRSIDDYIQMGSWVVLEENVANDKTFKLAVSLYGKSIVWGKKGDKNSGVELLRYERKVRPQKKRANSRLSVSDNVDQKELSSVYMAENLLSLERQVSSLIAGYDRNEPDTTARALADIHERIKSMNRSFGQKVATGESQQQIMDESRYKAWDMEEMMTWIAVLDNGRYYSYLDALQQGFEAQNILSGEQLCELDEYDLMSKPFFIMDEEIINGLVKHFRSLNRINDSDVKARKFKPKSGFNPYYNASAPVTATYQ